MIKPGDNHYEVTLFADMAGWLARTNLEQTSGENGPVVSESDWQSTVVGSIPTQVKLAMKE